MGWRWEEAKKAKLSVAPILAYWQAVRAETHAYVTGLAPDELERKVPLFEGQSYPVATVLALMAEHTAHHVGEITAPKGVQGAKGLPH